MSSYERLVVLAGRAGLHLEMELIASSICAAHAAAGVFSLPVGAPPCPCTETLRTITSIEGAPATLRDRDEVELLTSTCDELADGLSALRGTHARPRLTGRSPTTFGFVLDTLHALHARLLHLHADLLRQGPHHYLPLMEAAIQFAADALEEARRLAHLWLPEWLPVLAALADERHGAGRCSSLPVRSCAATGAYALDEVLFACTPPTRYTVSADLVHTLTALAVWGGGTPRRVVARAPRFFSCLLEAARDLEVIESDASDDTIRLAASLWEPGASFRDALGLAADALAEPT